LLAYNPAANQFYVTMHANGVEGSHKQAADEIWRIDLTSRTITARGPGGNASFIAMSPGPNPVLYGSALDTGTITRFNPDTLAIESSSPQTGLLEGGGLLAIQ
jgi:methylamine dehydrogenase heavy chain